MYPDPEERYKMIKFNLLLLFVIVILLGCQPQNDDIHDITIDLNVGIKEINIFASDEFHKEKSTLIVSHDDETALKTLHSIITSATEQEGIVNMINPNYKLEIVYEEPSSEQFYLWIAKDEIGSLMKVADIHTIYNLSEDMSDKLYNLLQSDKN